MNKRTLIRRRRVSPGSTTFGALVALTALLPFLALCGIASPACADRPANAAPPQAAGDTIRYDLVGGYVVEVPAHWRVLDGALANTVSDVFKATPEHPDQQKNGRALVTVSPFDGTPANFVVASRPVPGAKESDYVKISPGVLRTLDRVLQTEAKQVFKTQAITVLAWYGTSQERIGGRTVLSSACRVRNAQGRVTYSKTTEIRFPGSVLTLVLTCAPDDVSRFTPVFTRSVTSVRRLRPGEKPMRNPLLYQRARDEQAVERAMTSVPAFPALKKYEPETYAGAKALALQAMRGDIPSTVAAQQIGELCKKVYVRYVRKAPSGVARRFMAVQVDLLEQFVKEDPVFAYKYLVHDPEALRQTDRIPHETAVALAERAADVFRAGVDQPEKATDKEGTWKIIDRLTAEWPASEVEAFNQWADRVTIDDSQKKASSAATLRLCRAALALPDDEEAAAVLRLVFGY